ncbi:MAG: hypothetical protein KDE22_02895, partial [Rhodobacterales bacterium]|nr:hypothetical protein [Rhodobacterales bacterium]
MRDHGVTSPAGFVAGVFLALMLILAGHPAARASTGGSGAGPADLPAVLSDADADRYRQIFEMQEDGQWKAADRLIKALEDPILMGHVLAQRYLHATAYRSQYKELKDWMAAYADHPEATRIYKLALRRRPKNWRMPKPPQAARDMGAGLGTGKARTVTVAKGPRPKAPPRKALTKAERAKADAYARKVRHYLRNGWTKSAKRVLNEKEVQALLPQVDYDTLRAHLGHAYFVDGHDDWALQWAGPAAKRSGRWVPQAHWTSGLAAWRLKKFADAASHFEAVAARPDLDPEMRAAGAFWAARTHMIDGRPDKVNPLLLRAAAEKRTFYGLLARKLLGLPIDFAWEPT